MSLFSFVNSQLCLTAHLTIEDSGSAMEIAAIMNYANITTQNVQSHKIVIIHHDGKNQTIPTISGLWEPLTYPLFFPHATLGWRVIGTKDEIYNCLPQCSQADEDSPTRQIMHYQATVLQEQCWLPNK